MENLKEYWNQNYRAFLEKPETSSSWRIRAISYLSWPLLFNRVMDFFDRYVVRELVRKQRLDLRGKKVLDIGCGTGRWSQFFNSLGAEVVGIDLVPAVVVENGKEFGTLRFSAMTADRLGFRDETFDLVSAPIVLQHLPPEAKVKAVREIARVLKPGGIFFLLEAVPVAGGKQGETSWLLTEREWRHLLSEEEFEILEGRPLHAYPLAAFYLASVRGVGQLLKRLRGNRPSFLPGGGSGAEEGKPQGILARRYQFYEWLHQGILTLLACVSFPLEFPCLALRVPGDHWMFLIRRKSDMLKAKAHLAVSSGIKERSL